MIVTTDPNTPYSVFNIARVSFSYCANPSGRIDSDAALTIKIVQVPLFVV